MIALIDGDIINYRVGFTTNEDQEWIARARTNEMVEGILADTGAKEFALWLSDQRENNFRTHLWAGYKANRKNVPRPVHYDYIKELLINEWGARIAHGMEADDALGIGQDQGCWELAHDFNLGDLPSVLDYTDTVICSIDKDLLQVPGRHFNFVKKEWRDVTPQQGQRDFYRSILVGDATDNIKGCRGIGPVKAEKAFGDANTPDAYFEVILDLYKKQEVEKSTEEILQHILLAGRLLKIRTEEDEPLWGFQHSQLTKAI